MQYDLLAWVLTFVAAVLMVLLPRQWALLPLLVASFFVTLGQYVEIFGLDFPTVRLLILVGWARLFLTQGRKRKLNTNDKLMIWWVVAAVVSHTLLWQTSGAFINRLGLAYNALGIYFLVRSFVWDVEDIERVIRIFAFVCIGVAASMLVERATGRNAFAAFGGVPFITEVRDGKLRSQGAFLHSITAGTFGAMLFPLFVALYASPRKHKILASLGLGAATIITITSSSSGPVLSYLAGILGLCMWPFRERMRTFRWGIACGLVGLDLVMKAPVWALLGRIRVFSASDSYHRVLLIDQFFARFSEWWLWGTQSTATWADLDAIMHDVTNHYIRVAVDGGLLTLLLFVALITYSFRGVGRAREAFESQPALARLSWALGVSLFVNVVSFMGVSYFDQITVAWYALLAMSSVLYSIASESVSAKNERRSEAHSSFSKSFGVAQVANSPRT